MFQCSSYGGSIGINWRENVWGALSEYKNEWLILQSLAGLQHTSPPTSTPTPRLRGHCFRKIIMLSTSQKCNNELVIGNNKLVELSNNIDQNYKEMMMTFS